MKDPRDALMTLIKETPIPYIAVRDSLANMNIIDIGDTFDNLNREQTIQVFRMLPKDIAAHVFAHIIPEKQQIIIEALTGAEAGTIINSLFMDDAVDFIEEMPANVVTKVLSNVTTERRATINQLLRYPEDSIGSIMTTEFMAFGEDLTVMEAFDQMRKTRVHGLHTCYVVRRDKILVGYISLKTLLLAKQHQRVGDLTRRHVISAGTQDDQEKAAALFQRYDLLSLPIVDSENRLVGIITVDDVVEIVEEEATEDFEKMAGIMPLDDDTPYLKTGVLRQSVQRIGWLLILMFAAIFAETILTNFEDAMAALPALIPFIPMLMDTGGNAGVQTSSLIIRSMALDEIFAKDLLKAWWKEIRIALLCGLGLSVANAIRVLITGPRNALLTLVISLTLMIVVVLAKSMGCLLPMVAKKLRIDPAVMAAPIIKTLLDVASLFMYFSIARLILPGL
ncbi:MAG: magnesium transporter [Defluviitaleaceae bacterium]|nr:magnesium transporter [Defluviitaleaceae bacterium]